MEEKRSEFIRFFYVVLEKYQNNFVTIQLLKNFIYRQYKKRMNL